MSRIENDLLNYKSRWEEHGILKNKLGIEDPELLNKCERMITTKKLIHLYLEPGEQTFDIKHYISIHKYLFEDIYEFAGEIRNENINKRIPFCRPEFIYQELNRTLNQARLEIPIITDKDKLVNFVVRLHADLDVIHPFREGNGRTEREYIRQIMDYICKTNNLEQYYLDYSIIENPDEYIDAVVEADCYKYEKLTNLFNQILTIKTEENINKKENTR